MKKLLNFVLPVTLLLMFAGFIYSPYYSLKSLGQAIDQHNSAVFDSKINRINLNEMLTALIEGKLKLKLQIESEQDPSMAMTDYVFAQRMVDKVVDSLLSPYGFFALLQGRLDYIDARNAPKMPENYLTNQQVTFDSLTQAHFIIDYPKGLHTKVMMKRTGLMDWEVEQLIFPVDDMLRVFVKALKKPVHGR